MAIFTKQLTKKESSLLHNAKKHLDMVQKNIMDAAGHLRKRDPDYKKKVAIELQWAHKGLVLLIKDDKKIKATAIYLEKALKKMMGMGKLTALDDKSIRIAKEFGKHIFQAKFDLEMASEYITGKRHAGNPDGVALDYLGKAENNMKALYHELHELLLLDSRLIAMQRKAGMK